MMEYNSGIYSLNEFTRKTNKFAPDLFVEFNGALGVRFSEPLNADGSSPVKATTEQTVGFRGGITSISTSASLNAGQGNCTIQVSCPMYNGLHDTYYVNNPDGTKTPFFQPMTEVKVYAKGRFLATKKNTKDPSKANNSPRYYVIFWGFVTGINESMSGGNASFTLSCKEMLYWWQYQNVAVSTSAVNTEYGGKPIAPTGTILRFLNPWEIIINLFRDTGFENFVYPTFMNGGERIPLRQAAYVYSGNGKEGAFEVLVKKMGSYWKNRFQSAFYSSPENVKGESPSALEMFGLQGRLDLSTAFQLDDPASVSSTRTALNKNLPPDNPNKKQGNQAPQDSKAAGSNTSTTKTDQSNSTSKDASSADNQVLRLKDNMEVSAKVTQDFGLIGKVMPYANFSDNLPGPEATTLTKLEIAHKATDSTHLEFFQDVNGKFVFKPPFYNMDTSATNTYRVKAEDIISINESFESDAIVNGLEVTGPMIYLGTTAQYQGAHYDFGSIARFGLRYKSMKLPYGNNPIELRQLAVAEMTVANAQAFTASLEIPLRPELRLGYPVYIDHLDCFYYINGISHSFSFGSSATTTLTLNAKRSKMWDYTVNPPQPLRAHIYQTRESWAAAKYPGKDLTNPEVMAELVSEIGKGDYLEENTPKPGQSVRSSDFSNDMSAADVRDRASGLLATQNPGLYVVVPSVAYFSQGVPSANAVLPELASGAGGRSINEIVNFTEDSVPYTDVNGYLHIGGFPFGANLSISDRYDIKDITQLGVSQPVLDVQAALNIKPADAPEEPDPMAEDTSQLPTGIDSTVDPKPSPDTTKSTKDMKVLQMVVKTRTDKDGNLEKYAVAEEVTTIPAELVSRMMEGRDKRRREEAEREEKIQETKKLLSFGNYDVKPSPTTPFLQQ